MRGLRGEEAEAAKTMSGAERSSSRGVLGWVRQSSVKRFGSREVSGTPREDRRAENGIVCTSQPAADNDAYTAAPSKRDHSLAAMFRSVSSRAQLKDEIRENAHDDETAAGMRRAHTAQSLSTLHANSMVHSNSMHRAESMLSASSRLHASSMLNASIASIDDYPPLLSSRSARSDPGDLIAATHHEEAACHRNMAGEELPQLKDANSAEKETQGGKSKRIGSSTGLSRIGSFLTRSFSRHRSRSSRHSKKQDERVRPAEGEAAEVPTAPLLSDAVSGLPALPLASLDALPDFSAADWLGKFEREGGGAASGVMSLCGGALEAVATHLDELEKNIRSIQQSEQHQQQQRQQQQQQQQKQRQQEDSADAAQGVAEMLAAARQKMDEEDERVFSQMKYHGEQLVIGELQQMIATVKNIMLGIKYAAYSDTAVQHDLQGEEKQMQAWQEPRGALRQNRNCLEALYARVRSTRDEVLLNYHEECIRLNQNVQLLMDRITTTVAEVFAEFETLPSLETLYGKHEINNLEQKRMRLGAELRSKGNSSWAANHQLAFGRLPPFIARLQLYALNLPSFSEKRYEQESVQKDAEASNGPSGVKTSQLFTPVTLQQCLPRKSCVNTVPPGLALVATEAEIKRYESQLWGEEPSGTPGEGGFGSFRVFEQWLVDAMKWQWRDAFMYSKLHARHGSLQEMIKEKQRDIQEAVRLRLKQLWWGRTVEMQAFYVTHAATAFMRDLQGVEGLHAVAAEEGKKKEEVEGGFEGAGAVVETLRLRSGREAEIALMHAEDMRASVLRVVGNPAYRHFSRTLEEFNARPSDATAHIRLLKHQMERAGKITRRFEDAMEGKDGYETLERECCQLEAALALLEEEAKTLEHKLSFRQTQLSAKRQGLTHSLEQLSAAFDSDNKKLAAIEAQWDSAENIGQLLHDLLPTADEIAACKHKLAEEKKQLETEKEEIKAERQRLQAMREVYEKTKQSANTKGSPASGHLLPQTRADLNIPQNPTSPLAEVQETDTRVSRTPSKSFVGRLFGVSSRPSTPRRPKGAAHGAAAAAAETLQHSATRRRGSVDGLPEQEDLLALKHGHSSPGLLDKLPLRASKEGSSGERLALATSQQTNAEQSTHDLPGLPLHALSSPSSLTLERDERQTPSTPSLAVAASPAKEAEPHYTTETQNAEDEKLREFSREDAETPKRRKSKNAAGAGASRRGSRKKKSMYSKLRSAFSLSHSSKKGSKNAEPAQPLLEPVSKAGEPEAASEAQEVHWVQVGSQSSVLATIPNIFESDSEGQKGFEPSASPGTASAAYSMMVCASSRSEGSSIISNCSSQPASPGAMQQQESAAGTESPGRLSRTATHLTLTAVGRGVGGEASPAFSLAESFRRASPDHRAEEGTKKREGLQSSSSLSKHVPPLSTEMEANKFPSDSSEQKEHSPQFGNTDSNSNEDELEEVEMLMRSTASDGDRHKAMEYQAEHVTATRAAAGPLVPFPSLSVGSPSDFRSGVESLTIASADPSFQAEEAAEAGAAATVSSKRRSSDTVIASSVHYPAGASRKYGRKSGSRAAAFERVFAAAEFRRPSTAGIIDEDDRIELFLSNGQPDLTAAVMSSSIFALLEPEERQHCAHLMVNSFVQIPKGCMLVQRGEKVDTLYFLVSGELGMTGPNAVENRTEHQTSSEAALTPPAYSSARRRSSYDAEVPQNKFPVKIRPGAFVLPRGFVREAQTNHSIMALRPCTLQKLSFHSFQQIISACIFRRASQVMNYLNHCPILDSLTRRERVQIATLMKWRIYLPDEVLCFQGEICSSVLLVVHGCARAVRFVERQGNPDVVDEFGPGDNINALALLHDTPSDVSIVAAAPGGCVVAVLERSELQESLGDAEVILSRRFGNGGEMQGGRTSGLNQLKKQFSSLWSRRGSG